MAKDLIPLLVGGAIIVGLGYVAYTAWGNKGPTLRFIPNPITAAYTGMVTMTAQGFQPGEELVGKIALPDGTIIPTTPNPDAPAITDSNGNFSPPPSPVDALRFMAVFMGPVTDWTITGKISGLSATTRLTIYLGPAPASTYSPYGSHRLPFIGSYSGSAMRINVMA